MRSCSRSLRWRYTAWSVPSSAWRAWDSAARRNRSGQRGAAVVAARAGGQPGRRRRRCRDRRSDRRLDRLCHWAPPGLPLFDRLGRRFPNHFGPGHVMFAERLFDRWGARAVFFGRFIALLRIFAGPLAGALKMRYARFFLANVSGALCWAGGTTALVYYVGMAAERWLTRFLDRVTSRCRLRGDRCNPAARAHIPRDCRPRGRALRRVRPTGA